MEVARLGLAYYIASAPTNCEVAHKCQQPAVRLSDPRHTIVPPQHDLWVDGRELAAPTVDLEPPVDRALTILSFLLGC